MRRGAARRGASHVIVPGMTEEARTRIHASDNNRTTGIPEIVSSCYDRNSFVLLILSVAINRSQLEFAEHVVTIIATFLRSYRPTRASAARRDAFRRTCEESRVAEGGRLLSFKPESYLVTRGINGTTISLKHTNFYIIIF